jgi:hypothetical protein
MTQKIISTALLCLFGSEVKGRAQSFRWESVGVRSGYSATTIRKAFHQTEAFVLADLPWGWDLSSTWRLQSRLDLSAGWLSGQDDDGFVATGGLELVLKRLHFPLSFEAGLSPTILSRYKFGDFDMGIPLQFTSHAGLQLDLGSRFRLGYRIQHMSNGRLSTSNPGLNLHMLGISYRF